MEKQSFKLLLCFFLFWICLFPKNIHATTFQNNLTSLENKENYLSNKYNLQFLASGKGEVQGTSIKYLVKDSEGRCGNPDKNKCAAIATVKYETETIKYYIGTQMNAEGTLLDGSCRSQALISVINAIKNTKYSTIDIQNYLYRISPYDGILKASNLEQTLRHFGVSAKIYHSELSRSNAAKLMRSSVKKGQPVMIFVANSLCNDLATTHHAYIVLDIDDDDHVVMIDSVGFPKRSSYQKRTPEELSKCLSAGGISDAYYRMIVFSFDTSEPDTSLNADTDYPQGGSTVDPEVEYPPLENSNRFDCETIFYYLNESGQKTETEFKKILDNLFLFIKIMAPVIAVSLTIVDYIKTLMKTEDFKKANSRTLKRITIAIVIAFLPYLLDLIFKLFGLYDLGRCGIG